MYKEHLKNKLDIGISLPDQFYIDVIQNELSIIYYGEKIARIIYKKLNKFKLSEIEKSHEDRIKKIIKEPKSLDIKLFYFFKTILKTKNSDIYQAFTKDLEQYSIYRYRTLVNYINDEKIVSELQSILDEEADHFDNEITITYKRNFDGYEDANLYGKYKNTLKIDYDEFKKRMWATDFYKSLRGSI